MTLHPSLVKVVLAFFKCSTPILGSTYLLSDVDVQCRGPSHTSMLIFLAIPGFFFYIIGIPLIAGFFLFINRHTLQAQETRETFGFLYSGYESAYYGWELVIILRLVAMATVSVLFEGM